jgi:hypothetical protein
MSGDKLLSAFAAKVGAGPPKADEPESDSPQDFGAFGWLRGHNRAIMLELRFRNGNIVALGYSWLEEVRFDPSDGIILIFAGQRVVRILGRNLNAEKLPNVRLFDGLIRHKVTWVQESDEASLVIGGGTVTIIESIQSEFS